MAHKKSPRFSNRSGKSKPVDPARSREELEKRLRLYEGDIEELRREIAGLRESAALADRQDNPEETKSANLQLLGTMDKITDGFLFCDRQWRCRYINNAACRILRRKREELIGRIGWDVCVQTRSLKFNKEFTRAMAENVTVHFEEFYPDPLNIWVECHVYPTSGGLAIFFQDITKRKKEELEVVSSRESMRQLAADLAAANQELLESRRKFQDLVQKIDDIIFETGPDGRITFVSSRIRDVLGYEPEQAVGRMPSEFFGQAEAAAIRESLLQIMNKHSKLEGVEVPLTRKDGRRIIVETNAVPFFIRGKLGGYRGVLRDITARRSAEESLRLAINAANEPIYDFDLVKGVLTWNEAFAAQFGDPPSKFDRVGKWWISRIHPDDAQQVLYCIRKALESDLVRSVCDYRFRRRDGNYAFVRDRFSISRDPVRNAARIVGTMLDITDQKRRESELELINVELEKHSKVLDQILSASPDYIFLFDVNGTYAYVNDRAAALWGMRKEDIIGRSWRDIGLNSQLTEEFHPKIHRVIDENVTLKGSAIYPSNSGPRHFEYTMAPLGREGRRPEGIMLIAKDMTERKRREANAAFLADIKDDLARLTSVDEIMQAVSSRIGSFLHISFSYFAEIDKESDCGRLSHIWHSEDVPRLPETVRISDFQSPGNNCSFSEGKPIVVTDTETDPRTTPEFFRGLRMRSFVAVPFQYYFEWKFLLVIADCRPREWLQDEIELIREIANRLFPRLERARSEAALRDSEEKFRTLSDTSPNAILVYRGNRLIYVNQATVGFFGGTKDELLALELPALIHPDSRGIALGWAQDRMRGKEEPARYEMKAVTKSGEEKWLEISSRLIQYEGSPAGLAIGVDITERKQAEDALQRAKEHLEDEVRARTAQLTQINKSLLAEIAERKNTETKLRSAQKHLRAMAAEVVISEERQRQNFATDLHDTVVQTLGAAKLRAQLIEDQIPKTAQPIFADLQSMLSESVLQARTIMSEMSPPVLNELGIFSALEWLTEDVGAKHGLSVKFEARKSSGSLSLPHDVEVLLFQAARELLTNVVKHAKTSSAIVRLSSRGRSVRVTVSDKGTGFDPREDIQPSMKGGFGLYSIRERLKHVGGSLTIKSKSGQGTTVLISVPLQAGM